MKALTVCQPYADLIMTIDPKTGLAVKRVENRTWPTKHRGPLYIHAGKSRAWLNGEDTKGMVFGAFVGLVQLIDCVSYDDVGKGIHDKKYPWLGPHEHASGPWCWILDKPASIGPWPWRGAQGLWTVDAEKLEEHAMKIVEDDLSRIV